MKEAGLDTRHVGIIAQLTLVASIVSCSEKSPAPPPPDPPRTSVSDSSLVGEDLAVYSAFFAERKETQLRITREFLLPEATSMPDFVNPRPGDWSPQWQSYESAEVIERPVPVELLQGFVQAVAIPGSLPDALVLPHDWTWIAQAETRTRAEAAESVDGDDQRQAWGHAAALRGPCRFLGSPIPWTGSGRSLK